MNRYTFILVGATAIMSTATTPALRAEELNDEQKHAVHMFGNAMPDALEKLSLLKKGNLKMDWEWYQKWEIGPVNEALELCRKSKLPADAPIEIGSDKVPFSHLEPKAASYEADMKAAFNLDPNDKVGFFRNSQPPDCLKRYEAFKAQMTKGLSGDKLRIMNEEVLITAVVYAQDPPKFFIGYYGEGKKLLTKQEDFLKATIWATTDYGYTNTDTLKLDPHWRVHVYHFDGMKLVSETSERGPGTTAPDKFFQAAASNSGAPANGERATRSDPATKAPASSSPGQTPSNATAGVATLGGLILLGGLAIAGANKLRSTST